jgi:hypothetical protein
MTLRQARRRYFDQNGFGVAATPLRGEAEGGSDRRDLHAGEGGLIPADNYAIFMA